MKSDHMRLASFIMLLLALLPARSATSSGLLDLSFDAGSGLATDVLSNGVRGSVNALATQSDGKVVIGGAFASVAGVLRNSIARLQSNGAVDSSFDPRLGGQMLYGVRVVVLQDDGRVLLGGDFTSVNGVSRSGIARLHSDGSVDPTFNPGSGIDGTFPSIESIRLQNDGRILIGGWFSSINQTPRNSIARLNRDGSLDAAFSPSPIFDDGTGNRLVPGAVNSLALQPDGKVLMAGRFTKVNGTAATALVRLNSDGTLDSTFQGKSWVSRTPGPRGYWPSLTFVSVQPDGKILFGGEFGYIHVTKRNGIERLNSDGTRDTTFGVGAGLSLGDAQGLPQSLCALLLSGGKILLAGNFTAVDNTPRNQVALLNRDGTLDPFAPLSSRSGGNIKSAAVQSNGNILISGTFTNLNSTARNGIARLFAPPSDVAPPWIELQPTNQIVVKGSAAVFRVVATSPSDVSFQWRFNGRDVAGATNSVLSLSSVQFVHAGRYGVVVRNDSGETKSNDAILSVDPGAPGLVDAAFDAALEPVSDPFLGLNVLAVQPDGRVLAGGHFSSVNGRARNSLARFESDGRLDAAFGLNLGASAAIGALAALADGRILVGGTFDIAGDRPRQSVARLHGDGSLDTDFSAVVKGPITSPGTTVVSAIARQSDGRNLIGGNFTNVNGADLHYVARLNDNGTLDAGFVPKSGPNAPVRNLVLLRDGKILIAGDPFIHGPPFTLVDGVPRPGIARLNSNGTLDATFLPSDDVLAVGPLAVQADGRIVVGGSFKSSRGDASVESLARLNGDGSRDFTFKQDSIFRQQVHALTIQSDGKILIAGIMAMNPTEASRLGVARLEPDGRLDASFRIGTGVTGGPMLGRPEQDYNSVNAMVLLNDQGLVIGGSFTVVNGQPQRYLARLFTTQQAPPLSNPGRRLTVFNAELPTLPGKAYRVEFTDSLFSPKWSPLATLTGDGSVMTVADPGASASQRFYRVRIE